MSVFVAACLGLGFFCFYYYDCVNKNLPAVQDPSS
jgi:hypothetical protein